MRVQMETPSGVMATIKMDVVRYRHYNITQHAIERFAERARMTLDNLFVSLDRAVLADARRARDHRIQQQIRQSEKKGGYCMFDPETQIYFFMAVGQTRHTICTIMTRDTMIYDH
ncbi:hypothetical protein GTB64_004526 [Salmonella enterica]|nr:hypothetical protein [Salmonella enterica]